MIRNTISHFLKKQHELYPSYVGTDAFDNGSRFLSCLVYPGSACFTGFLGHQSFCLVL